MKKTIRQQIIDLLEEKKMSVREISQTIRISEKEVYEHLLHIKHSVKLKKKKLRINPFYCLLCDYIFKDRKRLTKPGRCPRCKRSHISPATYWIK